MLNLRELQGKCNFGDLLPSYSLVDVPVEPGLAMLGNIVGMIRGGGEGVEGGFVKFVLPVITGLLEEAPIGAIGSKAIVQWVRVGSANKAVVVPEVVAEQVKGICEEGVIRKIWGHSLGGWTDGEAEVGADEVLGRTGKEDKVMDDWDKGGTVTAKEMAAKDAKPERRTSFWGSGVGGGGGSSWAKKLSNLLGGGKKKKKKKDEGTMGEGFLVDTSNLSRDIAKGGGGGGTLVNAKLSGGERGGGGGRGKFDLSRVRAITPLFCVLLSRWGGTGWFNVVSRRR